MASSVRKHIAFLERIVAESGGKGVDATAAALHQIEAAVTGETGTDIK
jgi:hypothetical protein